jgi:hypothetical protein
LSLRTSTRCTLLAALFIALTQPLAAHPTPFSNININVTDAGADVTVIAYAFDFAAQMGLASEVQALDRSVVGDRHEKIAAFVVERLEVAVDDNRWTGTPLGVAWSGPAPPATGPSTPLGTGQAATIRLQYSGAPGRTIRVTSRLFPYDPLHESFISVRRNGTLVGEAILTLQQPSAELALDGRQSRLDVIKRFTRSGIEHIAIGPDHVLFLIGLLLLGGTFWQLVRIVTAFTIAHSVTLTLAALDMISLPAGLIEPLIALSICVVAVDNLIRGVPDSPSDAPRDHRIWIAFGFGLIHGFGFANVLRELALPRAALGWSLFSFNLGVEIGQLVIVVIVAWLMAAVARRGAILHRRIVLFGSLAVLWAGFFWFVQRLFFA